MKSAADIFLTEPSHFEQFLSILTHGVETDHVFKIDGFNLSFPPFGPSTSQVIPILFTIWLVVRRKHNSEIQVKS